MDKNCKPGPSKFLLQRLRRVGPEKNEDEGMDLHPSSGSEPEAAAKPTGDAPMRVEGDIPMCAHQSTGRHATCHGPLRRRELTQADKAGAVIMFLELLPYLHPEDVQNVDLRLHCRRHIPLSRPYFLHEWASGGVAISQL
eukprot:359082-Chlamydomonas_euryale.AAC.7